MKPQRIILIRHGESEGNINKDIYDTKPDYALELTQNGVLQAEQAGKVIASLVGEEGIAFYVSPMWRTRMTFENIVLSLNKENISYKEDPRLREQEWGHLRSNEETERIMIERDNYGTFYYRFLHGESGAFENGYDDFRSFIIRCYELNRVKFLRWIFNFENPAANQ
jgi:broad specificity phosphatase PhoE